MHKNMYYKNLIIDIFAVTFRKEGVDWNISLHLQAHSLGCHLPQGRCGLKSTCNTLLLTPMPSPSARKVWIEILMRWYWRALMFVTFRKEGVDWNVINLNWCGGWKRHLPQGRCGLKSDTVSMLLSVLSSPSARKVWIEILVQGGDDIVLAVTFRKEGVDWNWPIITQAGAKRVTFRKEGVDWNFWFCNSIVYSV